VAIAWDEARKTSEAAALEAKNAASETKRLEARAGSLEASLAEQKHSLDTQIASLENAARQNEDAAEARARIEHSLAEISEKVNGLAALGKIWQDLERDRKALSRSDAEFKTATGAWHAGETEALRLDTLYLDFQAGVLARDKLKDGVPCPVCGSLEHPSPASLPADAPTREQVKAAKEKAEAARQKTEALSSALGKKSSALDEKASNALAALQKSAPDADRETSAGFLAALLEEAQNQRVGLDQQKRAAEKRAADFASDKEALEKARAERRSLDTRTDATDAKNAAALAAGQLAAKGKAAGDAASRAETAFASFNTALRDNGFSSADDYAAALLTQAKLAGLEKKVKDYEAEVSLTAHDLARLETEAAGKTRPDFAGLQAALAQMDSDLATARDLKAAVQSRLDKNRTALANLREMSADFASLEARYKVVKPVSDAANGLLVGREKIQFETYVQAAWFERILYAANRRLAMMTDGRFELFKAGDAASKRGQTGLEIDVLDNYNGKRRPAQSLSGGESFKASMSLALGLSDIVQETAGGVHLDAMFIDEGFGTLDQESLDTAISTLQSLSGGKRAIGIISHVSALADRIEKQVRVTKSRRGSVITTSL
jgi:exonuclease SbcC